MPATVAQVRRNTYVDSITLLQLTADLSCLAGVVEAAMVMATELNREVLANSDLLVDDAVSAGPNDLVVAIRADSDAHAAQALDQADALLAGRRYSATSAAEVPPRSLRGALRADPQARLAVISVPGPFAASEAAQALAAGLHVFLFSDNVPLDDEVRLKDIARQRNLLVMGPDCGTAILNGVGFGFANVVRRGSVGVVGASGTGIQEVTSLVHQAGHGISHAIGTGSRDLHAAVGGITTLQAIALLRDDPGTETIVLVSKPSDPAVAQRVLRALADTGKPGVAYLQGSEVETPQGVTAAPSLAEAARLATGGRWNDGVLTIDQFVPSGPEQRQLRGLYCGGTLCQETRAVLGESNDHVLIDFGDDEYTRGRAHPMIDPTLRNQAIAQAGRDRHVAVVLLDVILGLGAHADPAGAAAPAIRDAMAAARAAGRDLAILAHVVGTDADPQGLARQRATLEAADVHVFESNYLAAVTAERLLASVVA